MNNYWIFANNTRLADLSINDDIGLTNDYNTVDALSNLSELIDMGEANSARSIPSPWARSWLFQEYMLKPDYKGSKLSNSLIGQWRGIMAMLALHKIYTRWDEPKVEKVEGFDDNSIDKTIYSFKPERINNINFIGRNNNDNDGYTLNWDNIYVLKVSDQIVGLCSPTTIICPCNAPKNLEAPWVKGNQFCNPIGKLSKGEKILLFVWLSKLKDTIEAHLPNNLLNNAKPLILDIIEAFINDIKMDKKYKEIYSEFYSIKNEDILNKYKNGDMYKILTKTDINLKKFSNKELIIANADNVILLGESESNKPEIGGEKLIWGFLDGRIYKRFINEGETKQEIINRFSYNNNTSHNNNANKYHFIETDSILLNKVFYFHVDNDTIFNANHTALDTGVHKILSVDNYFVRCSAPISKEACRYIINPILDNIKLSYSDSTKKISTNIIIDIENDFDDKKNIISIDKEYQENDMLGANFETNEINEEEDNPCDDLPALLIFPNIKGCSTYYVKFNFGGNNNYFIAPISNDSKREKLCYSLNSYPDILGCYLINNQYVGVIDIRNTAKPAGSTNGTINYALDLGTSSTVIAYKNNNSANPQILDFINFFNIISARQKDIEKLNTIMFPYEIITSQFQTIHYAENENRQVKIYEDGYPYFITLNENIYQGKTSPNANNNNPLKSSLKIEAGFNDALNDNGKYLQLYMRSMFVMILCDAKKRGANTIYVKAAFPLSLNEDNEYESALEQEFNAAKQIVGNDANTYFSTKSESLAAAQQFNNNNNRTRGNIAIDIGGGTTDIFMIFNQNGNPIHANLNSIKTGARKMFIERLKFHKDILPFIVNGIRPSYQEFGVNEVYANNQNYSSDIFIERFEPLVEWLLNKNNKNNVLGDVVINYLNTVLRKTKRTDEERAFLLNLKFFRTILTFEIISIAYYCGLLYSSLELKCSNNNGSDNTILNNVDVKLCGNGSKILKWIGPDEKVKQVINYFIKLGSINNSIIYQPSFSASPKKEVSYGLLKSDIPLQTENITKYYSIGEELTSIENKKINPSYLSELNNEFYYDKINIEYPFCNQLLSHLGYKKNKYNDTVRRKHVAELDLYPIVWSDSETSYFNHNEIAISKPQVDLRVKNTLNANGKFKVPFYFTIIDAIKSQINDIEAKTEWPTYKFPGGEKNE